MIDYEYIEKAMWGACFREGHQFFNFNDAYSAGCIADQLQAEMMGWA